MVATTFHKDKNSSRLSRSQMWRPNIYISYIIVSIVCCIYVDIDGKSFLSDDAFDGFTIQVNYVWNYFAAGNSILTMEPLLWIHALRALIAYIFVYVEDLFGSGAVAAISLSLFFPMVTIFSKLRRGILVIFVPLMVVLFSPRTFLVIISVAYLVAFISRNKPQFYLVISFFLANLSSGAVMNNLVVSMAIVRNHRPKSISLYIYAFLLAVSLAISATDKYAGFAEQRSGYSSTVYGASGLQAIISRSTIYVSLVDGNYVRFGAYAVMGLLALTLFFFAWRMKQYRGYVAILASAIPSLIFEGLGFISLLVPVLLLLAGARLPWRPISAEEAGG